MKYAAVVVMGVMLAGCVSVTKPHVSSIPYDAAIMGKPKQVYAAVGTMYLFGVIPLTLKRAEELSTRELLSQACEKYEVDAVINTCVDSEWSSFLGILHFQTLRMTGLGVKLK